MAENYDLKDVTVSPYSFTLDSELAKNYKDVLWVEGRGIQGQELNNAFGYLKRTIKEALTSLGFKEGSVIRGSLPVIAGTSITIPSDIYIWAKDAVCNKSTTTTLSITGVGNETIGCTITREIYDETDDSDLLDPATAWQSPEGTVEPQNSGEAGAHRIKYSVTFSTSGYEYAIWNFKDGVLQNPDTDPVYLNPMKEIKRRTKGINGNCAEKPVNCYTSPYDNTSSTLTIPQNTYYVEGERVDRIQETKIAIPHATDYESVNGEAKIYTSGTATYAANEFPIKNTSDMVFTQEGYVQVTRGNTPDTSDTLCSGTNSGYPLGQMTTPARGSAVEVLEVYTTTNGLYDGTHDVEYTIGTDVDDDCYLDGNNLNWGHTSGNGATEPAGGSNYFVHFKVSTTAILGTRVKHEVTNESINIASTNDKDLAHNDVFGLDDGTGTARVLIGNTSGGDDYVEGTDFTITNHLDDGYTNTDPNTAGTESDKAQIHWLITPPAGTVYVTYGYWEHTKEGHYVSRYSFDEPYEPAINSDTLVSGKNTGFRKYISWNTACSEKPVNGSTFLYDYDVYRGKRGIVEVMSDQDIEVSYGASGENAKYPEGHITGLIIAKLDLPPDSPQITVYNQKVQAKKQSDIRELTDQVQQIEERISEQTLKLDHEAKIDRIDNVKFTFYESCIDTRPIEKNGGDIRYNSGGVAFAARYNIDDGYITLPYASTAVTDMDVDVGSSTVRIGEYISLQRSVASIANTPAELKNTLGSDTFKINPYGVFTQDGPYITVDPSSDTWIDNTIIIQDRTTFTPVTTSQATNGTNIVAAQLASATNFEQIVRMGGLFVAPGAWGNNTLGNFPDFFGDQVFSLSTRLQNPDITRKNTVTFARSRTIAVAGSKWQANDDNIRLTFDGIKVDLTPTGSTQAGTMGDGTVKANSSGEWTATFVIPTERPTGQIDVLGYSFDTGDTAATKYTCQGTYTETIERQPVIQTPALPPSIAPASTGRPDPINIQWGQAWPTNDVRDPLGQEILPSRGYDVGKAVLYFNQKDSTVGGFLQLKELVEGNPERKIKKYHSFRASDVSVSTNGATGTEFTFAEPWSLYPTKEYMFVVGSNSSNYLVYYAKPNGTDTVTGVKISENAHPGNFRTSSNSVSWDVRNDEDLKFVLCPYIYSSSGVLYFDNVTTNLTSFEVKADVTIRPGTSVVWQYSVDNGATWTGFEVNKVIKLSDTATQIKVRATLTTTDTYVSPLISNTLVLRTMNNNTTGKYISRNIAMNVDDEWYKVNVSAEINTPSTTSVAAYISPDNGSTWTALGTASKSKQINGDWTRYWWDYGYYLSAPALAANDLTATTGGVLTNGTYYYKITATNTYGETIASTERSITLSGLNTAVSFDLTGVLPTGATGFNVYRSGSTGTETLKHVVSNTTTPFLDDGSDPDSSSETPPSSPTARDYKDNFRLRFDMTTATAPIEPKIGNIYANGD